MTRIVKLGSNSSITNVASFEEAFGDYSSAGGKRRAKKAARKSDRTAKKTQRKLEKVASKDTVKRAKREGRTARRTDRKQLKQTARQDRRTGRMQSQQERTTTRKDMRVQRKKLGQEPELEMDDQLLQETGNGYEEMEPRDEDQYGEGAGEYETTQQGYEEEAYEEEGDEAEEPYYEEDEEEYSEEDEGPYAEDEGEYDDASQTDYDDEDYVEDEYGFDGVMGAEDRFSETTDSNSNKKSVNVDVNVQGVAKKIEWNKELVSRLRIQKARAMGANQSTQAIEQQINERLGRIKLLQEVLNKYQNFEGDFSSADGKFTVTAKRNVSNLDRNSRIREVNKANALARRERAQLHQSRRSAAQTRQAQSRARSNNHGGDVTPVEVDLDPKFSKQRIEIPGQSNATGTGLTGLDDAQDFDAPETRVIELTSNADGAGSNVNWKGIVIGVAVGGLAIWAINKYKLLGK